jgi:hypothetical protein
LRQEDDGRQEHDCQHSELALALNFEHSVILS